MPDRTTARREDAILEVLEESSPATTADLATALETHPVTIERRCRALYRSGRIRRCTGGAYALAESDADRPAASVLDDATADRPTSTNPAD